MPSNGIKVSPVGVGIVSLVGALLLIYMTYRNTSTEVSLKDLLVASIEIAERGGNQVREIRMSSDLHEESKGKTREGANNPLTLGDKMSHQIMSRSFKVAFPNVPLISEENDGKPVEMNILPPPSSNEEVDSIIKFKDEIVMSDDITIWIDPLDATQEYTENLTEFVTTMVCIAVHGRPVIGVIHKPFTKETFWGWVGYGTNVFEKKVGNEDEVRIIVSRSHAGRVRETAEKAFGHGVTVVPAGGAGFKSLALFNGKASVYIHTTLIKKWDICAGNAILLQSGGDMTTLAGMPIDYSHNSNPKNEGGLVASLHEHEEYLQKLGYA